MNEISRYTKAQALADDDITTHPEAVTDATPVERYMNELYMKVAVAVSQGLGQRSVQTAPKMGLITGDGDHFNGLLTAAEKTALETEFVASGYAITITDTNVYPLTTPRFSVVEVTW